MARKGSGTDNPGDTNTNQKLDLGGKQVAARTVPHPCQNALAQTVVSGHSRDVCRLGDLDSGRYRYPPSKPDKEGIVGSRAGHTFRAHHVMIWPELTRTTESVTAGQAISPSHRPTSRGPWN